MNHFSNKKQHNTKLELPTVSIITVVYNGEETLLRTIQSISNQTYQNIEYIIVDGASNDGTSNIIEENKQDIDKVISEPDEGLYDAMNKGLSCATGEYVWFINSGDEIAHPEVLSNIFKSLPCAEVYYGNTMIVDKNGEEIGWRRLSPPEELTWKDFKKGMVVSHQSIIIKKSISRPYQLKYKFSADYDWVLYALRKAKTIVNTHQTLSRFLDGGLTKKNILPGLRERFNIMINYFGLPSTIIQHLPISFKFIVFIVKYRRF